MKKLRLFLLMGLAISFIATSCYKKKDTIARVTVKDASGSNVSGVEVRLFYVNTPPDPREDLEQTNTTDGAGVATFNYNDLYKSGQAGFAILDIEVNGVDGGIIRIEEETTSEVTVTL